jgi:cysteine desulfurase
VLFTSGATESNNWAIKSLAMAELAKPQDERRMKIVVTATEHASVLSTCEALKPLGFEVVQVKPQKNGEVSYGSMKRAIKKGTLLVCCLAVNNETGAKNPVGIIGKAARDVGAIMLCDVTQAMSLGGESMLLGDLYPNVDLFSFSGHKLYGPTGIGCLIKMTDFTLPPLMTGGSQEFGLRSGTSNVAGAVGMAAAMESLRKRDETQHFTELRDLIIIGTGAWATDINQGIIPPISVVKCNCAGGVPNILSLDFSEVMDYPGTLADAFATEGIAVSAGAACSVDGGEQSPSHVLLAMGRSERQARHTVRISFTKFNTKSDAKAFVKVAEKLIKKFPIQEKKGESR